MDPGGDLLGAAEEWHYSDGHRVQGPVARETLSSLIRVGQLGPGSLVWHPPWEEWRPLGQVEDFAGLFPDNLHPTPPPLPGNPSGSIGNHCGTQGCVLGGIDWVWCPSGTFRMGSPSNEPGRSNGETNREVTLERGFWIGKFPVTRAQWMKWMADDPGKIRGRDLAIPVENVSWHDARRFCERMSRKEGARSRECLGMVRGPLHEESRARSGGSPRTAGRDRRRLPPGLPWRKLPQPRRAVPVRLSSSGRCGTSNASPRLPGGDERHPLKPPTGPGNGGLEFPQAAEACRFSMPMRLRALVRPSFVSERNFSSALR